MINRFKRRQTIEKQRTIRPTDQWKNSFELLMYVVTLPTTVLWILAALALLGILGDSNTSPDDGFTIFAVGGLSLFFGDVVIAHIVMRIDWLFNLGDYTEQP